MSITPQRLACFLVVVTIAAPAWAQSPPRPVAEAAVDLYTPVSLDQQRFGGIFSDRTRANIEGYLEHVDAEALLRPFESRSSEPANPQAGESAGLYLVAASNAYEYSDDVQLKAVMDRVVKALIRAQEKDGYLGIYSHDARWSQADVLTHASALLGLLTYAHVTGEDDAGIAARRASDLLLTTFGGKRGLNPETAALVPAIAELYRSTGDARYLAFGKSLAAPAYAMAGSPLVNALSGYGLMELYRLTADDSYLKSAAAVWQKMQTEAPAVTGVPGNAMHLDACTTLAWFQFTLDLLRLTGQPVYAATLESTIYNALLPAQDPRTGNIDPAVSLSGPKHFRQGLDVCSMAASMGLTELTDVTWGRYGPGLAVLSYTSGRATLRLRRRTTVQLYAEGTYPENGSILLHVQPTHDVRFPLRLYVPSWTREFHADIGGSHLVGQPGTFLILTREWRKGDTVKITIELTPKVVKDPASSNRFAVRRGPQLLTQRKGSEPVEPISESAIDSLKLIGEASLPSGVSGVAYGMQEGGTKLLLVPFSDPVADQVWLKNR